MTSRKSKEKATRGQQQKDEARLRRVRFAKEYLTNGRNATKAAEAVGFSAKTAASQGSRLLKHVEVQQAIQQPVQQALEKVEVKVAEVAQETTSLLDRLVMEAAHAAFLDPKDFYDANGKLLGIHEMPEHARRAIATLEAETTSVDDGAVTITSKVKPNDKLRAIEVIAKLKALMPKQGPTTVNNMIVIPRYRWRTDEDDEAES